MVGVVVSGGRPERITKETEIERQVRPVKMDGQLEGKEKNKTFFLLLARARFFRGFFSVTVFRLCDVLFL